MTLSELKFIVAVAQEKNFRKAADKCFVSQPALSLAIKKLEDELGLQLFKRSRKDVSVTSAGQKIINQANVVINEAAKIKEIANYADKQTVQSFKLGLIYSIAPYLLPVLLPKLKESSSKINFEVEEDITKNLEEKIIKGNIDAAIIALPFDIPSIDLIDLYDEEFVVIVPNNHEWATKEFIKTNQFSSEKVLLLDNTHCFSSQVKEACPGLSKKSEIQMGNSLETIRNMVASNLGVSVLPKSAVVQKYNNPLVSVIPFETPVPFRRVALAFKKSSIKKEGQEKILQAIKNIDMKIFNPQN